MSEAPNKNSKLNILSRDTVMIVIGMMLGLVIPIFLTLDTVRVSLSEKLPVVGVSPYGYTVSLLLFIVPVALLCIWFHKAGNRSLERRSFYISCLIIFLFGSFLDFIFGYSFFNFPDPDATLNFRLPSFSFYTWSWVGDYLPIEEFLFYIFGAIFMVSLYVFGDEFWFKAYNRIDYKDHSKSLEKLFRPHLKSIFPAILLLVAAWFFKFKGDHGFNEGIPGYFTFEVLLAICPTILFFYAVKDVINYRAFSFMLVSLTLISIVYEATLGVPFGWWAYNYDQMVGITITAWANLPIEAVLLWFVAAWASVILYEFLKVYIFAKNTD